MLNVVRMIIIMIHIPLLLILGNSFETICQMFFYFLLYMPHKFQNQLKLLNT